MVVDEKGEIVGCDHLTAWLAQMFLKDNKGAADRVRPALQQGAAGDDHRSRRQAGEVARRPRVHEADAGRAQRDLRRRTLRPLLLQRNFNADSGAIAFASVVSGLAAANKPMSELIAPAKRYAQSGEINFETDDKEAAIDDLRRAYPKAKIDTLDGITLDMGSWWCNVRAEQHRAAAATEPRRPGPQDGRCAGEGSGAVPGQAHGPLGPRAGGGGGRGGGATVEGLATTSRRLKRSASCFSRKCRRHGARTAGRCTSSSPNLCWRPMNDTRPARNARPAMRCVVSGIALAVLLAAAGCTSTTAKYSYYDVAVTITDADSGAPIAQTPFRVVYPYSPYHVQIPMPDEVRAETDAEGKAVVKLADYARGGLLYMDDIAVEGYTGFVLTKDAMVNGGVTQSYTHPRLTLDLCPTTESDDTSK